MILTITFIVLSLALSGTIYYLGNFYQNWYLFWVPILLIPIFYLLLFALYICFLFFLSLGMKKSSVVDKPHRFWYFWVRQTAIQLLFLSRTKIDLKGIQHLDRKKRYVVISNHISMFDPMLVMTKLKLDPLICVTKKENLKIPICGAFIHHAGFIPLDREDKRSGIEMIQKSTFYLKENLSSIYICPEGTRSKSGDLLPFHPGSFKMALKAEADLVICYIENTNLISKHFPWKRTKTKLHILQILPKEEILEKTTIELADLSYQIIKNYKEQQV